MPDGNFDPASDLTPVYEDAGKKYGWDPDLLRAQTRVESGGNPYAVSDAGAEGMSQFIPSTARSEGLKDPFDPHESIPAQAKLLRENAEQLGSPAMAVAAYHGGTDPSQWGEKTRAYLDAVDAEYARLKAQRQQTAQQAPPQPPAIGDQIKAARQAGYSDDEIASYLGQSKQWAPKFEAGRKAGYLDDEMFSHLGLNVTQGRPLTSKQAVAQLPMAQTDQPAPKPVAAGSPQPPPAPAAQEPSFLQRVGNFADQWLGEGQARGATQQAGAIFGAAKQAYQNTPPMLSDMAQQWADQHGIGSVPHAAEAVLGAFNAAWTGSMEAADQFGQSIGMPQLGRDAAAMIEHAGLSGAPHGVFHAADAAMTAAGAAAQEARLAEERGFVSPDRGPPPPEPAGLAQPSPQPSPPPPMGNAPPHQAPTMEESALSELNPEWTKPVLQERAQGSPAAGAEAHAELENVAEGKPATAPTPEAPPAANAPQVINLGGMGAAIGDNLRNMLWDKFQKGDLTELGRPSRILQAAANAGIQTREQFDQFAQDFARGKQQPAQPAAPQAIPMPAPAEPLGPPEAFGPPTPPWQRPGMRELPRYGPPETFGPPPPGTTRLYRIGPTPAEAERLRAASGATGWLADATQASGADAASGRWFTPDLEEAQWYAREHPEAVRFVDVPNNEVQRYRATNDPSAAKFTSRPDKDFFLPTDIANRAETFGPQAPPWQTPGLTERERLGPPEAYGPPAPNAPPEAPVSARVPTPQVEPQWGYVLPTFAGDPQREVRQRLAAASTAEAERSRAEEQPEHPGLVVQSLETGKRTTIQPKGTRAPSDWTEIGRNYIGQTLYQDQNGARSYVENGVRSTEPVGMIPGKGVSIRQPADKAPEYQVAAWNPLVNSTTGKPVIHTPEWKPPQAPVAAAPDIQAIHEAHGDAGVAETVADRLDQGTKRLTSAELQRAGDHYYGGKLAEGAYGRDRLYDAQELGVNRYIQRHPDLYNPAVDAETAKTMAGNLESIKSRLPTQTVRAGEKDTHQQFSTPPDFSYAAAWAANMRPEDRVLEPSAGTGSLAVMAQNAKVAEVTANEISPKRQNMLSHLGVDRLTTEDARQIHNTLPEEIKPTVVLMNPPFSAAPGRMGNKQVLGEGAAHVKAALDRLEPGGRLVAIVGRGMTMDAPAFRDWWKAIGNQYDVRANVGVGGGIYHKYGTNFGTRLLVIDKAAPSRQAIVGGEVGSAADLIDKLEGIRNDRPIQQLAGEPSGAALAESSQGAGELGHKLPGETGVVGAGERPPGAAPEQPQPAGPQRRGTRTRPAVEGGAEASDERQPVAVEQPGRGADVSAGEQPSQPVEAGELPDGRGKAGGGDGVRADGSGERDEPGVTPDSADTIATEKAVTEPADKGITEAVYENYKPQRLKVPGAKPHPGALVQSAAMASVMPPEPKYAPKLPKALIASGGLSDAQLESVVYAGQAHSDVLPDGKRRGFFIGDGTGVGKGREIAGIILDNMNQGRGKHIWISESKALINDAKRDWSGLGQNKDDVIDAGKVKAGEPIKVSKGILFSTYATLRASEQLRAEAPKPGEEAAAKKFVKGKSRVDQLADWFGKDYDGVIVFDEAHNMGNAVSVKAKRGVKQASQMAKAGLELQEKLPNARVVYVSATGATEVNNLAYADRLGLWAQGTAFPDRSAFLSQVSSGGMAAMELVARDMKALGHYVARNLSYDGVEYDRLEHKLTPDQRQIYNKLAEGWQVVLQNFTEALKETGGDKSGDAKSAVNSAFWGGHQRFFNQVITSLQMPSVIKGVERDLKEGRQAVLQLVNTNEASQERALEKVGPEDLEDLDMTPRDQLMQMVEKAFPTQEYEEYEDESGNVQSRPVVDSKGNPVHNKAMVAQRDKLLDQLGSIRVPDGPLEILLNHFGTDKVAEVTGRKQRVVRREDEDGVVKTMVEKRGAGSNVAESDAFQTGKKPILIFSQAGGTGRSYHADNTAPSAGARRSHYLVQPGWRADKAVQGFGRTHRTNQASAPIFHLVTTDLEGQRRFISSIARRLGQLGALTKGERRTGDQGLFGMRDNLESDMAVQTLHNLFREIHRAGPEGVDGVTMDQLEKGMGLKLVDEKTGSLRSDLPPMPQFLNRMLSLSVDGQNKLFRAFGDRLDTAIARAASAGTLDTGVETYQADKINKKAEQTVYTDPGSGAETRHVHLEVHNKTNPTPFDQAARQRADMGFVRNNRSGRVYAMEKGGSYTDEKGRIIDQYRLTGPNAYQFVDRDRVDHGHDNWSPIEDHAAARELWNKEVAATPPFQKSDLHLITGAVLPIWDRLKGSPKIYRLQTDKGERMLGRVVPNSRINETLDKLGAEKAKITASPGDIAGRILQGDTARLANDWTIKRSLVAGEPRMELIGPDYRYDEELAKAGVFKERIQYQTRYFVPTGDKAAGAIEAITKGRPVVQLGNEYGGGGGGESLYSFPGALFDPAAWRRAFGAPAIQGPHEVLADKEGMARAAAEIKAGFAPTALRGAKPMEYEIRAHTSRSAQAHDIDVAALEKVRGAVDRLPMQEQVDFSHRMETGQAQTTPELQKVADALRSMLDGWAQKVQGLGRGYLANAIENYMGHIWGNYREWSQGQGAPNRTQAQMQSAATAGNVRKAPLRGSGAFLKQRSFPTQLEGINAGLVPVTYNPVDLQLIKAHEMRKFYFGTVLADRIKAEKIARWVPDSKAREAEMRGEKPLDDRIFQPKLYGVTPIGPVEPGKWYAPEPAARIFNNYMSEGWANHSSIYDAFRMSNNALNGLQLGIGGFHAAFVTNDVATSKVALGLQQISRGELGRGGANLLFGTPVAGHAAALTDSLIKGGRVRRAWLDPSNAPPEMKPILAALQAGGYRMTMPDFFRSSTSGPFFKHWNDLKNPSGVWRQVMQMFRDAPTAYQKAVMTPIRIAARTLDTTMEPLMGALVPRAKAGVMYDLAADWLRRNPTATPRELSAAMTKFQDSVDNRLGQLNYDNLFWNKTLKDVAFITTRSVGWNLGTARELGGAFADSGAALKAIGQGRAPQLSTRMAYAIAMPIVTGMLGAVLTYMATGQGPQSLLDYFYPPTGTANDQDIPERRSIPGYMKDVFAFAHDPIQTVLNKTSPMIEAVQEIAKNRDYYGGIIYNPERDRGPAQAYGDFLINQATPFSLRSWGRLNGEGAPAIDQSLGFFGFQPAPASITNPQRGEHFQRREMQRATKTREKEVTKGLSVHIFNRPGLQ